MTPAAHFTEQPIIAWHEWVPNKLFSFRIKRPQGYRFTPGQFARLGIRDPLQPDHIIWRAYSMVSADYDPYLEFYSIVVPDGAFTSRLAHYSIGDTLYLDNSANGFLTTAQFTPAEHLLLLATGTGIAPFISIIKDLQVWENFRQVTIVHGVRETQELAYQETILTLAEDAIFSDIIQPAERLRYACVVTREPNVSSDYCIATKRLTHLVTQQQLPQLLQRTLEPDNCRIMVCGNPDMLKEMRHLLKPLGFKTTRRDAPGNLALENYW